MSDVWGGSWGSSWGHSWAEAVLPPVATLVLGEIRIRPALAGAVEMETAISADIDASPLLSAKVRTDAQ
ncbi:hypothetical protein [Mesorhizobium sp. GbtcB19]|uniref:hypothetical protein n=1 Tax=Mesorhizobium sp. GbtcB19 TaxID=2824764 RepID=UPI001C2F85DD|nr:hypothetical protein [Mesorhizobium sp. GbtcB19]